MPSTSLENLSSRELSQNLSKAKLMADNAPIVITERNEPAYVLMSYEYFNNLDNHIRAVSNDDTNNELSDIRKIVERLSIEFEMLADNISQPSIPIIDKSFIAELNTMSEILKEVPNVLGKSLDGILQSQQENMSKANSIILDDFIKKYDVISEKMILRFMNDNIKPINDLMINITALSESLSLFKKDLLSQKNNKTWWKKLFS